MKLKALHVFILLCCINNIKAQIISLAGQWKFAADSLSVGEAAHWEKKSLTGNIHLPGSTDEVGAGNYLPLFKSALGIKPPPDYPANADFGMLTRKHKYLGMAWYQKEITVSADFENKQAVLNLERVLWRSKVWVDGQLKGTAIDYLSTPHLHSLGKLNTGKHTITIMIDNREIYPIGTLAHSYCPHMQTQWNGVVGKIELIAKPLLAVSSVQVFPFFQSKKVRINIQLNNNEAQLQDAHLVFIIKEKKTNRIIVTDTSAIIAATGISSCQKEIQLKHQPAEWDEFNPHLYELVVSVASAHSIQKNNIIFGFRDPGVADKHFTINGRKIVYRNGHEGMFFAQTGYPAMDKNYWLKLFAVYKNHGLNAVRFHSACPPEAAFDAADELGIYLQVEFFWMDGWMHYKSLIGGKNDTLNNFVRNELHNALVTYGNHPSMMLVAIGNELGGNFTAMGEWIAEEKKQDPRHFYAAGIAHKLTAADDFVEYGGKADILMHNGTDWDYKDNYTIAKKHNYDLAFRRKDLPEFTHETGQYVVHPVWSEINKYKGVLAPLNLQYFRNKAKASGIEKSDSAFQAASGNLNRIFYKAEIEATLRTNESAGYGLLGMVDYPGQGEALMGWVDPLYKNKNFLTPQQFRQYGNHTVPLLRMAKFVWQDGETLLGKIQVANYGKQAIEKAILHYVVTENKKIIAKGRFAPIDIIQGALITVGEFSKKLISGANGKQLNISIDITGTPYKNNWDIWVFPKPTIEKNEDDVIVTSSIDTALIYLKQARKVLLLADKSGPLHNKSYACFSPVFWSGTWFYDQESEVLGAVVHNQHPALQLFPTNGALDWQWQSVCINARGFILNELPKDYQPIIQPVDDYHFGKKLGSLFELTTVEGGRLMVCGYSLNNHPDSNIAAAQLRKSILHYMRSAAFQPKTVAGDTWLIQTFTAKEKLTIKPKGFETAFLYVNSGGNHALNEGEVIWDKMADQSFAENGFDYSVSCSSVLKAGNKTAWTGKKIHIEITVPAAGLMVLKLHFADWDDRGRLGEIYCEDAPLQKTGIHQKDEWISIPITRENCLDGKLILDASAITSPDIMIAEMVLEPQK